MKKIREYTKKTIEVCRNCGGAGEDAYGECEVCGGSGRIDKLKELRITVSPHRDTARQKQNSTTN